MRIRQEVRRPAGRGQRARRGVHDSAGGKPVSAGVISPPAVARSESGPVDADEPLHLPPAVGLPRAAQAVRFTQRQIEFVFRARRMLGEVFWMHAGIRTGTVVSCHPDHARALFTAKPEHVPSLTAESSLRPIVGPNSVLTANGERHLRQRRLLLPQFHGDAVARYVAMIEEVVHRELEEWPTGIAFPLAGRMQAITLEVIMSGIFGVEGQPAGGSAEERLRATVKHLTVASTLPIAKLGELLNFGSDEPVGVIRAGVAMLDSAMYAVIEERRGSDDLGERTDILSLLLSARTDEDEPLSDRELRDELITLVLAGFETTANSLAWTWERLLRTPEAYDQLCEAVRSDVDADEHVEATILEGMRSRPVIPIIGRRVQLRWRLGEYVVPAGTGVSISTLLLHHREDLYPEPFAFRPERWFGRTPGTYEWIPFGGGTRRCLGAQLAMAEQRVVLKAMAGRLDLEADRPDPEHALHRIVTMIPARGARAIVRRRLGG